jgi:hypothetical protein
MAQTQPPQGQPKTPGVNLPGSTGSKPNPPPLVSPVTDPLPDRDKIEAQWNVRIRPALKDLIAVLNNHPELVEWAKRSTSGSVKVESEQGT